MTAAPGTTVDSQPPTNSVSENAESTSRRTRNAVQVCKSEPRNFLSHSRSPSPDPGACPRRGAQQRKRASALTIAPHAGRSQRPPPHVRRPFHPPDSERQPSPGRTPITIRVDTPPLAGPKAPSRPHACMGRGERRDLRCSFPPTPNQNPYTTRIPPRPTCRPRGKKPRGYG